MNCWHCASAIEVEERVGFRDCCPRCDRAVHVCRNCTFFEPGAHNQCREPMAELVADKDRANFCEYFAPVAARTAAMPSAQAGGGSARGKLEELFKKR